jgi:NADH pyrophosphatase NudC (nudix superfamily)
VTPADPADSIETFEDAVAWVRRRRECLECGHPLTDGPGHHTLKCDHCGFMWTIPSDDSVIIQARHIGPDSFP